MLGQEEELRRVRAAQQRQAGIRQAGIEQQAHERRVAPGGAGHGQDVIAPLQFAQAAAAQAVAGQFGG
ncbi:hypothetical protein D3C72_1509080 [compost metagenome]